MCLSRRLGVSNPLLQDILRFLYELSMKINGVAIHTTYSVVFPKYVVGRLFVVLVRKLGVMLSLLR